ncbi:CaiB/BaiF CoA transferase family protein [Kyrpidia spormannii]|nr:CaiB/BaiF CoA-transferase family protein [Kyrpidia spormannii]
MIAPMQSAALPLAGVRVLDLSRVLAGPFCTMLLGDLGADVVKVESPRGGDETRAWGPPFVGEVSAYYLCANRNKRSIAVNLKTPEGLEIIRRLAAESDVVIENFRPGKAEELGVGYSQLKEVRPDLVYCSISGFGQTGPYRNLPGYDFIVQAMSGLMSITGEADGRPMKVGVAVADVFTGLFAALGIVSALRVKERTGVGQYIDLALMDVQIAVMVNVASNYLVGGNVPRRYGNQHPNIVPYQTFEAADGEIAVAVGNDRQFRRLCEAMGVPEWAEDPRFATNDRRVENRDVLIPMLQERFRTRTGREWMTALAEHEIPCGPIQTMDQVFADPQVQAREMVRRLVHPSAGEVPVVANPLKLSETPVQIRRHPPDLGEHTEEILLELGYTLEQIEALEAGGSVRRGRSRGPAPGDGASGQRPESDSR